MVEPYISFKGQADEAINFYEMVFNGTDKKIWRFSDMPENPEKPVPDDMKNWVAHSEMIINGTVFNFGDIQSSTLSGDLISLMIRFKTVEEVEEIYHKLMDGGEALMGLAPQVYAKMYGWVKDKFGVGWQLICE